MDMGLGKTVCTLTALRDLHDLEEITHTLILAPSRVAKETWPAEVSKWEHLHDLDLVTLAGVTAKRRKELFVEQLAKDTSFTVINYELLPWIVETLLELKTPWPWDAVVLDEVSMLKHHTSTRFKILNKFLCDTAKRKSKVKHVIALTATPAPSGVENLYSQTKLVDMGQRLGKTVTSFREAFMENVAPPGVMWPKWKPKTGAFERVVSLLSDITLSMRVEDYEEMPDLIYNDIKLPLPDKVRKDMVELEKNSSLKIEDDEVFGEGGSLIMKLIQFCSGAVYTGDPKDVNYERKWAEVHDVKIKALKEIVDTATRPMMIGYWFESDKERIMKAIPSVRHIDSEKNMIQKWNNGEVSAMLVQCASVSHGLNLQHGGSDIVIFSMFWQFEIMSQLIGRLFRRGQKNTVIVTRLMIEDSVDELVAEVVMNRDVDQSKLREDIENYIERRQ